MLGQLQTVPALDRRDLLAAPVSAALEAGQAPSAQVAPIEPDLADTAAFCAAYDVPMEASANCVIVTGKRGGEARHAACVVLATTRADVNNVVRRYLDTRKASFADTDFATETTGMEYGGITVIGLPTQWPVLIDARVVAAGQVVVGSGIRGSKIVLPATELAALPAAVVLDDLAQA
ncbi:MAG TPA: YbaK/EbsC family protein [Nocardioidaceae bacterium]|nr:YbaK/EbsC family protein [Nocardioidaceae bacterium]